MNDIFSYPFDGAFIMKKQRSLKRMLLSDGTPRIKKNIAILGGSTADSVRDILELFLLHHGIEPSFWLSEYAQYYNDALYPPDDLKEFRPDLIYVHTTYRNIPFLPRVTDSAEEAGKKLRGSYGHFEAVWDGIKNNLGCPVIQNNFELPVWRLLGNSDCYDIHGRVRFVNALNMMFADHAASHDNFYINDINYLSACFGLDNWTDNVQWYMYKYALSMKAVPYLASNLAAIIKSVFGRNKKVLALDLDNTLWGGVVGDDGVNGIKIGKELPGGQVYTEFQEYIKEHKDIGVLLTVCSKNDPQNADDGLNHPDGVLKPDDFTVIKANWENKDINISRTAAQLGLLTESFVFADDNPAEREIVRENTGACAPEMEGAENYIRILDRNRYFEVTSLSEDDRNRTVMYKANAMRDELKNRYPDYGDYLDSLEMNAEIDGFISLYYDRIAQLTNKSNQFNVTTRRYTAAQIEAAAHDSGYITLYGKLADKFGDNGVVSVIIGRKDGTGLHIELWIMSCRVLKREMELAMLDTLVEKAAEQGIKTLTGYYYPTAKNAMVKELYAGFGFTKISGDENGNTVWEYDVTAHTPKTKHITINSRKIMKEDDQNA